jgi:hypothetical protein
MISQSINDCSPHETNEPSFLEDKSLIRMKNGSSKGSSEESKTPSSQSSVKLNGKTSSSSLNPGLEPNAAEVVGVEKKSVSGNERQSRDETSHRMNRCHQQSESNHDNDSHHHHNKKTENFSGNNTESQKNVWNYLIQQQEQERAARLRIHADDLLAEDDYDDEEEEALNDSGELEENDLQRQEQLINFRAKLSAFENLSKKSGKNLEVGHERLQRDVSSSASSSSSSTSGHHRLHPSLHSRNQGEKMIRKRNNRITQGMMDKRIYRISLS